MANLTKRRPRRLQLPIDNGVMPNSALPAIVYDRPVSGDDLEGLFRKTFSRNQWGGFWVEGVFGYDHFHSNAHEVMGVLEGTADLVLGGTDGGTTLTIAKGDVLILPAGAGHRRLRDSPDFLVLGGYPKGQESFDIYLTLQLCANYRNRIGAVEIPKLDPLYGEEGAVISAWRQELPTPG
jgi:uncharacterized protein YjlB